MFSLKLTRQPRKNSSMAQNKKYVFAQRDVDDYSCIKLTEAPYSDIIFAYTNVKFASEPNADGRFTSEQRPPERRAKKNTVR